MHDPAADMLLVDDDEVFRERLAKALRARGFQVRTAGHADEASTLARAAPPALAIVDLRMPGRSGLDLLRDLRSINTATRVIVLTGYGSIATAVEAMRVGAIGYLPKPVDADEILAELARTEGEARPATDDHAPSLARAEWEHIHRVLSDCDGNISEAARRLSLHRQSLQRKLRKYPPGR